MVEASGARADINTAIDLVKISGRLCIIGMPVNNMIMVQWGKMIHKVLDVTFHLSSSIFSWERALSIMASTPYDLSNLISHQAIIDDWEEMFHKIKKCEAFKVVLMPEN